MDRQKDIYGGLEYRTGNFFSCIYLIETLFAQPREVHDVYALL